MSHQTGIKSNERLRNFFAKSKEGNVRMIKVVISDKEELELAAFAEAKSPDWQSEYNECVLKSCESNQPCYIFFRMDDDTNPTTNSSSKQSHLSWLFIAWSPDFAPIKLKMLYAATKSTLKLEFGGAGQIKDELFGTAKEDVSLEGYRRHVRAQQAPAPLTNREEELEILRQNESQTRINVDTKHKTLQGVMFPVEARATEKLDAFQRGQVDYLQLEIDIKAEQIVLVRSKDQLSVDGLQAEIPRDKGRFHLYRFNHIYSGEKFKSVVFVYSMPGFACSVKERMLYSSCKSELMNYLREKARIDIVKQFEVSEAGELTQAYMVEELHPKKQSDGLKFEKPKGPVARGPRRVTRPANNNNNNNETTDSNDFD